MNKQIDNALSSAISDQLVPGLVAAVGNSQEPTYINAFGKTKANADTDMRNDSIFRIASMTKAVTSVAIMQLLEQGLIDLDEPARKYLPSLSDTRLLGGIDTVSGQPVLRSPTTDITTRHLLTHTSGFGYEIWSNDLQKMVENSQLPSLWDDDSHYSESPLLFEPGSRWLYGISTDQLGLMVESVTGKRLDDYMRTAIFEPLDMADTGFTVADDKLDRLVSVSVPTDNMGYVDADYPAPETRGVLSGGGGLASTASDYMQFSRMLLNKGRLNGVELLQSETVDAMTSNQIGSLTVDELKTSNPVYSADVDFFPGVRKSWGLGFLINEEQVPNGRAAGSYSWAGLFNSYFWIDPASQTTALILMQVLPFFHGPCVKTLQRFEEAIYR
jgi:CubicO group peptidase (beta-lactamase class C family)